MDNLVAERIAILKYKKRLSIVAIKNLNNSIQFDFSEVSVEDIYKGINQLNLWNVTQIFDILKENTNIFSAYVCDFVNETMRSGIFPSILKVANITSVFKKCFRGSKENCCLVSILPVLKFLKK